MEKSMDKKCSKRTQKDTDVTTKLPSYKLPKTSVTLNFEHHLIKKSKESFSGYSTHPFSQSNLGKVEKLGKHKKIKRKKVFSLTDNDNQLLSSQQAITSVAKNHEIIDNSSTIELSILDYYTADNRRKHSRPKKREEISPVSELSPLTLKHQRQLKVEDVELKTHNLSSDLENSKKKDISHEAVMNEALDYHMCERFSESSKRAISVENNLQLDDKETSVEKSEIQPRGKLSLKRKRDKKKAKCKSQRSGLKKEQKTVEKSKGKMAFVSENKAIPHVQDSSEKKEKKKIKYGEDKSKSKCQVTCPLVTGNLKENRINGIMEIDESPKSRVAGFTADDIEEICYNLGLKSKENKLSRSKLSQRKLLHSQSTPDFSQVSHSDSELLKLVFNKPATKTILSEKNSHKSLSADSESLVLSEKSLKKFRRFSIRKLLEFDKFHKQEISSYFKAVDDKEIPVININDNKDDVTCATEESIKQVKNIKEMTDEQLQCIFNKSLSFLQEVHDGKVSITEQHKHKTFGKTCFFFYFVINFF
ncbi:uncharacterized protein LOC111089637 [Limulus polyphemus]|uniref:Uncharacterized protein LOC111089637 n=1 Tax=Limulus polyphemus TaxID=6850 RepID=A0ABM1TQQ4_LIMPO|nr:uncharacterized protein LOC111089637 [Limulus polyphemus]